MKKLKVIYFLVMLIGASLIAGCDEDDVAPDSDETGQIEKPDTTHVETPDTTHVEIPDTTHVEIPDTTHVEAPDTTHVETPVTEFKMKVNGEDFTSKVLLGRYFTDNSSVDIESHEVDSTFNGQDIIGIQVDFSILNKPGDYSIETINDYAITIYMNAKDGKAYLATEGTITIKTISETRLEASFSSIKLKSGYDNVPPIMLTDGSIRIDLVRQDD